MLKGTAMRTQPSEFEKQNLEAHAEANAMRFDTLNDNFERLNKRMQCLETKVNEIHEEIQSKNGVMIKTIIGTTGTIVASILTTIVVLLVKF